MQNIDYESIGLRIKHYRTNVLKISQEELAARAEIERSYLSRIENGSKGLSLDLLITLANVLNVSANDLLVDNLMNTGASVDSDIHYLLLDCSEAESSLITKAAKDLRKILRGYQIK